MSAIKLYETTSALYAATDKEVVKHKKGDDHIQKILLSVIKIVEKDRNSNVVDHVLSKFGSVGSLRDDAMHAYIQKFCNVVYDEESKKYRMKAPRDDAAFNAAFKDAITMRWTEARKKAEITQFDAAKAVKSMLDRAVKDAIARKDLSALDTLAAFDFVDLVAKAKAEAQVKVAAA